MNSWERSLIKNEYEKSLSNTDKNISSIKNKLKLNQPRTAIQRADFTQSSGTSGLEGYKNDNHQHYSRSQFSGMSFNEEQLKMISSVNYSIQMLTYEVSKIKEKQGELERVMITSDGISLDRIARELRTEIEAAKTEIKYARAQNSGVPNQMVIEDLSKQLKLLKRESHNNTDSLHREMDVLKSRMEKLEDNVTSHWEESQSTLHRCTSVQRDVGELNNLHKQQKRNCSKKDDELRGIKKELNQLSEEIYGMKLSKKYKKKQLDSKDLLDNLEVKVNELNNERSRRRVNKQKHISLVDSRSLSTLLSNYSDVDISSDPLLNKYPFKQSSENLSDFSNELIYDEKAVDKFIGEHEDLLLDDDDDDVNLNSSFETDLNNNKTKHIFLRDNDDVIDDFDIEDELNDHTDLLLTPSTPLSEDNDMNDSIDEFVNDFTKI